MPLGFNFLLASSPSAEQERAHPWERACSRMMAKEIPKLAVAGVREQARSYRKRASISRLGRLQVRGFEQL